MAVSNDELKGLYYYMNLVRQVDERCRRLFKQGRFHGTYYPAVGQEATVVGPCTGSGRTTSSASSTARSAP